MLLIDGRRGALIGAALIVIALPWFSDRGLIASALLGIGSLFIARDTKTRATLFLIYAVGAVALARYYMYRFGVPWPMYHNPYGPASMTYIPFNLPALLIDGSKGLFVIAPMMLGVGAAYVTWFRSRLYRSVFWLNVAAQVVTIVTTTSNLDWWGGGCPAGRYTVLLIWMSLPAWFFWLQTGVTRAQRWMLTPLFLFGLVESALLFTRLPWWHARFNPLFNYEWTAPVDGIFPDFMPGGDPMPLAWVWGTLFTAMMVAIVMAGRRQD